jgi:Zn-dependent peptidase ImmA (M78 family)
MNVSPSGAAVRFGNGAGAEEVRTTVEMVGMSSRLKEEARQDAARILRAAWTGAAPIEPVSIANELGVEVLEAPLDGNTLGALFISPEKDPRIVLNQGDSFNRQRFTCAHELGHYVRRSAESNEYARVDLRDDRSSTGEDPEEIYANEFAACLLMPESEVRAFADLGLDDLEMALKFRVSREAMQFRMKNLGLAVGSLRAS